MNHSRGDIHINTMESSWSLFRRAWHGVYHWRSVKHAHCYVDKCVGRYNLRGRDTLEHIGAVFDVMPGRRLTWKDLVA